MDSSIVYPYELDREGRSFPSLSLFLCLFLDNRNRMLFLFFNIRHSSLFGWWWWLYRFIRVFFAFVVPFVSLVSFLISSSFHFINLFLFRCFQEKKKKRNEASTVEETYCLRRCLILSTIERPANCPRGPLSGFKRALGTCFDGERRWAIWGWALTLPASVKLTEAKRIMQETSRATIVVSCILQVNREDLGEIFVFIYRCDWCNIISYHYDCWRSP